jgi:FAD-dependent urate hydroxylase
MDFSYDDVLPGSHGWGVHRGSLFGLLWDAVTADGIPVRAGIEVMGLRRDPDGWRLRVGEGDVRGPYDLIVGADGARSRLRRLSGLASKDVGYPWGALWSVVADPDHLAGDVLFQRYGDTRMTLGVLPTGTGQASVFWSTRTRDIAAGVAAGGAALAAAARPFAGRMTPLIERIADGPVLGARYRDVVVRSPALTDGRSGLVLLGDAAHAMSPQLGLGASLGLADAWTLAACLRRYPQDLPRALAEHGRARTAHVRYYTWCSRLMTPVFQSDLVPLGWARDLLAAPVARIPWVRRQFVTTLMGIRTSPFTMWRPPRESVPGRQERRA